MIFCKINLHSYKLIKSKGLEKTYKCSKCGKIKVEILQPINYLPVNIKYFNE